MLPRINWTKASEKSAVGSFIVGAVVLLIMVWPMIRSATQVNAPPASNQQSQKTEVPRKTNAVPWIMPSILAAALIMAGFLHYKAHQLAHGSPKSPQSFPPTHPAPTLQPTALSEPVALPPPSELALVPPPPRLQRGRVMANATPAELAAIYKNNTTIHAQEQAKHYIGTWLEISGPVSNVTNMRSDETTVILWHGDIEKAMPIIIFCSFQTEWQQQCSVLRKGNNVMIAGKISSFDSGEIHLENCEFI